MALTWGLEHSNGTGCPVAMFANVFVHPTHKKIWWKGNDQRWCALVVEIRALVREDVCHRVGFCPRGIRHTVCWWKCFRVPSNDFCFGCLWFFILVSARFFFYLNFWVRHDIWMGWSSAAMISNMSKRFAYLLESEITFFFRSIRGWIPSSWRRTRVVPLWSPQIVLILRPTIFDLDVCHFAFHVSTSIDECHN